ncbi:hypothetical protein E2C01_020601 [Portunus trituberculatus]|uniref:Uncharacterized protein n=1 Tax=Portunus trituberculatus TaxID=210409 RepID=A0A5B7E086_PORTR|nr:hypothetical protein [Portunus trituberculatus]
MMVVAAFIISLLMLNHYYTAQDRPSGGSDCTSQGLDATQLCSNHHYLGHPQVPQTSTKASTTPPITARLKEVKAAQRREARAAGHPLVSPGLRHVRGEESLLKMYKLPDPHHMADLNSSSSSSSSAKLSFVTPESVNYTPALGVKLRHNNCCSGILQLLPLHLGTTL